MLDQRNDLRRDDKEFSGCRTPFRRSSGQSLSSSLRKIAVLQLQTAAQDLQRSQQPLVAAGGNALQPDCGSLGTGSHFSFKRGAEGMRPRQNAKFVVRSSGESS